MTQKSVDHYYLQTFVRRNLFRRKNFFGHLAKASKKNHFFIIKFWSSQKKCQKKVLFFAVGILRKNRNPLIFFASRVFVMSSQLHMPGRRKIPKQLVPGFSALAVEDILTVSGVRHISREGLLQVAALTESRVPVQVIILLLQEGYIV